MPIAMEISHPEYAIQARNGTPQNVLDGLQQVFAGDPGLNLQLFLTLPLTAGGIALHLTALQWILTGTVTFLFLVAGVFRRASLIQIDRESSLNSFQKSRIRCMGNAIVAIAGGLSFFTYLMVFVPRITSLI